MAYVKYAAGIDYVKGALTKPVKKAGHAHGTYLVATHREAATANPNCKRIYSFGADRYDRTTPVTTKEVNIRNKFRAVAAMVIERKEDLTKVTTDQAAFLAQKDLANGKKTMKAYLWSVCGAEYDAQQG